MSTQRPLSVGISLDRHDPEFFQGGWEEMVLRADAIVFDLDGVLIDSTPEVVRSLNIAIEHFGGKPVTKEQYLRVCGKESESFLNFLHSNNVRATSAEFGVVLRSAYCLDVPDFFPGAVETVRLFAARVPIGIISGNTTEIVERYIARGGIETCVTFRHGGTTNKAEPLERFCVLHRITPSRVWYVGDTPSDMEYARLAGVTGIGIAHSDQAMRVALTEAGARFVIDLLAELTQLLGLGGASSITPALDPEAQKIVL